MRFDRHPPPSPSQRPQCVNGASAASYLHSSVIPRDARPAVGESAVADLEPLPAEGSLPCAPAGLHYSLVAGNFSPAPVSSHCALTLNSPAILSSCECGIPRENQLVSRWGLIFRNSAKSIGAILHSDSTTRRRTPEHSALAARSVVDRRPVRASFSWP